MTRPCLALALLIGCSSSPPPVQPVAKPRLQVTPGAVAFGRIVGPSSRQLTVRNIGDPGTELILEPPRLDSSDFTVTDSLQVTATAAVPGFKTTELVVTSNGGTVRVQLSADVVPGEPCEVQVSPSRLDFGALSSPRQLAVTVRSSGAGACSLTDVTVEGSEVFSLPPGQLPLALLPGEEKTLRVAASPAATGSQTGTLRIGTHAVQLSAQVAQGCLVITPNDFDFGSVRLGCASPRRVFTVYNACSAPVTIVGYGMLNAAGAEPASPLCPGTMRCPELLIDGTPGFTEGTVLMPGSGPSSFALRYHPLDTGPDTGAFQLEVLQNQKPVDYLVTLRGEGDNFGQVTDTYRSDPRPVVDVLFVLDDSPAMAGLRASVARNLDLFADYWLTGTVDLRLGVATASGDGGLLGPVVSDRTPMARDVFAQQVATVGTSGPAAPPLLATAVAAAPGLARDGGTLSIISVSNRDDASPLPVATYVAQLQASGRGGSFSAVGPASDGGQPRSREAVDRSFGLDTEVSDPDWHRVFRPFDGLPQPRTTLYLTGTAVAGTLVVRFDGVPQTTGWSYDATTNSVGFAPDPVPAGVMVTITYDVICR